MSYEITKQYPDKDFWYFIYRLDSPTELAPINSVVTAAGGEGVYIKKGSDLKFGVEDGHTFWTLNPKLGRVEYKFDGTHLHITKDIVLPVRFLDGKYWTDLDTGNGKGFCCLEDLIVDYYLKEGFKEGESNMTYSFGCRKYDNSLIRL